MGRRAARGSKVEVTELGPKWLPLLPMCSFSIMETILRLNTSRNSLEECFCRCEQHLHTPGRHHHTRRSRRGVAAPGLNSHQLWPVNLENLCYTTGKLIGFELRAPPQVQIRRVFRLYSKGCRDSQENVGVNSTFACTKVLHLLGF